MPAMLLFIVILVIVALALLFVWRYWSSVARVSPEESEYDERMAALNERQANRLSDEQLTQTMSDEDAWNIMVRRGLRDRERHVSRRSQRLLPAPRRERYGGDMLRRAGERRERFRDPSRRDEEGR